MISLTEYMVYFILLSAEEVDLTQLVTGYMIDNWYYIHNCPLSWNNFVFRHIPLFIPTMKVKCSLTFTMRCLEEIDQ